MAKERRARRASLFEEMMDTIAVVCHCFNGYADIKHNIRQARIRRRHDYHADAYATLVYRVPATLRWRLLPMPRYVVSLFADAAPLR